MADMRQELLNLIALNNAEKWVPEHIAFEQLLDRHADRELRLEGEGNRGGASF